MVRDSGSVDVARWAADLHALGLDVGDIVLVHTSLRSLSRGRAGAAILWSALLDAVAPGGTVLVPTLSYAIVTPSRPYFDVRSTPSCVGAFPEWARTQPGVRRSVHPTHSVAGIGPAACDILSGHINDRTPAGPNSPFRRLRDVSGKILMVGCGLRPNTSMHGVEELTEPPYLFAGWTDFTCTDYDGAAFTASYRCHGHFPQHYDRIARLLPGTALRYGRIGESESHLIDAAALWAAAHAAIESDTDYFTR